MAFNPNEFLGNLGVLAVNIAIFVLVILVGILSGYLVGSLMAAIVKKVLNIRELKEQLASSEILSLSFWGKMVTGIGVYVKWLFVAIGLKFFVEFAFINGYGNAAMFKIMLGYALIFEQVMTGLGIFLLFAVVGVVIGAVVFKIIKSSLDSVRVDERMAKHGLADALGGMQLTKVVAGIFMIYVVVIFLASGIDSVAKPIGQETNALVLMFNNPDKDLNSLVELYPSFVLGGLVIVAGAIVGDFVQDRIRQSKSSLASDTVGWLAQTIIIFFAVVIALPKFQITENVDILTESFKILVAGVSIGLAIAMGLGLKDTFAHIGKKVEKKL